MMRRLGLFAAMGAAATAGSVMAADLYAPGSWSAMASDRQAQRIGDSLTVVVYENSLAQNSAAAGSQKNTQLSGQASSGAAVRAPAQFGLNGQFDSQAQTERSGKLVAQITVVVDGLLPNGDLHVAGQQNLNISGDKTRISVRGRVRREDISNANTVLSTRLADASIEYDGMGFVARGGKPGVVNRVFNWLGLL